MATTATVSSFFKPVLPTYLASTSGTLSPQRSAQLCEYAFNSDSLKKF